MAREFFIARNFLRDGRTLSNETDDLWHCKRKTRNSAIFILKRVLVRESYDIQSAVYSAKGNRTHAIYLSIALVSALTIYSDNREGLIERSRLRRIRLDLSMADIWKECSIERCLSCKDAIEIHG